MIEKISTKAAAIRAIVKSIFWAAVFFIIILTILSYFGVNIIPLLTGAGLLGLAISLGAQSLVKDFIAGFFIIIEGQYNIGDKVQIGSVKGEVYKMSLRTTVLRDLKENLIYIPNSSITTVIKYTKS